MSFNIERLYQEVTPKLFKGSLPGRQREAVTRLVSMGLDMGATVHAMAYVLATGYWESTRFLVTSEVGKGAGRDYGRPVLIIRGRSETYFGRGWVQLTWIRNYALLSAVLSAYLGRPVDLVGNPALAESPEYACLITWLGMRDGLFTGVGLSRFFPPGKGHDYVGARAIINGNDKAVQIADIALDFERALRAAGWDR